jgi:hypothetical protein
MSDLSTEPFAVGCDGQTIRIGDTVTCLEVGERGTRWEVMGISHECVTGTCDSCTKIRVRNRDNPAENASEYPRCVHRFGAELVAW